MNTQNKILAEVQQLRQQCKKWVNTVVNFDPYSENPFLAPDLPEVFKKDEIIRKFPGKVFLGRGLEMNIDMRFEEDFDSQPLSTGFILNKKIKLPKNKNPYMIQDECNISIPIKNKIHDDNLLQVRLLNLEIRNFTANFDILEPILCYSFLYSKSSKRILTDNYYFTFPQAEKEFASSEIEVNFPKIVSFQIDLSDINEDTFLVIIMSHLFCTDGVKNAAKYYYTFGDSRKHVFSHKKKNRLKESWVDFAYTYVPILDIIDNAIVKTPDFLVIKSYLKPYKLHNKLSDTAYNKSKHLKCAFEIKKTDRSNFITCLSRPVNAHPILSPQHNISLKILSAFMKSGLFDTRSLQVRVSFRTELSSRPLPVFVSRYDPKSRETFALTHVVYKENNPHYFDNFIIELPAELPESSVFYFELLDVFCDNQHLKKTVHSQVLPLFTDGLLRNGVHEIQFENGSSLSVDLEPRTILDHYSKHMVDIYRCKSCTEFAQLLGQLQSATLITHLMIILYKYVEIIDLDDESDIVPLEIIQRKCESHITPNRLAKLLCVFCYYFALRHKKITCEGFDDRMAVDVLDKHNIGHKTTGFGSKRSVCGFSSYVSKKSIYRLSNGSSPKEPIYNLETSDNNFDIAIPDVKLYTEDVNTGMSDSDAITPHNSNNIITSDNIELSPIEEPETNSAAPSNDESDASNNTLDEFEELCKSPKNNKSQSIQLDDAICDFTEKENSYSEDPDNVCKFPRERTRSSALFKSYMAVGPVHNKGFRIETNACASEFDLQTQPRKPSFSSKYKTSNSMEMSALHFKVLRFLSSYSKDDNKKVSSISTLIVFITALAVKSFSTSQNSDNCDFDDFISNFVPAACRCRDKTWSPIHSLGVFTLCLFDIGFAQLSINIIESALKRIVRSEKTTSTLYNFLSIVIRPKQLYFLLKFSNDIEINLIDVFKTISTYKYLKYVFLIFNRCFMTHDPSYAEFISSKLIFFLSYVDLTTLPQTSDVTQFIQFASFVLYNCECTSLTDLNQPSLLNLCHFILSCIQGAKIPREKYRYAENVEVNPSSPDLPEVPLALTLSNQSSNYTSTYRLDGIPSLDSEFGGYFGWNDYASFGQNGKYKMESEKNRIVSRIIISIIRFMSSLYKNCSCENVSSFFSVLHHIVKVKPDVKLAPELCELLSSAIAHFKETIYENKKPAMVRFLCDYIPLALAYAKRESEQDPEILSKPIKSLFDNDDRGIRASAILLRTINSFSDLLLIREEFSNILYSVKTTNKEYQNVITAFEGFVKIAKVFIKNPNERLKFIDLIYGKLDSLRYCPASQIQHLIRLSQFMKSCNYVSEYTNTLLFICALSAEYSHSKWAKCFNTPHPIELFSPALPLAKSFISNDEIRSIISTVPCICDGVFFSEVFFIENLQEICSSCLKNQLFDIGAFLIDLFWPLLENMGLYGKLSKLFEDIKSLFESASNSPPYYSDAMNERYFKVDMIGNVFGEENNTSYVYHCNRLTHLYDFSNNLVAQYNELYPGKVALLTDLKEKLDPNIGYIHVTHLKNAGKLRPTLGKPSHDKEFYHEKPFTKEGRAQGSIETQWIRRYKVKAPYDLPFIQRRIKINPNDIHKDYSPIQVAYKQIRERTEMIQRACTENDFQNLQQLLHGSLLVQVNAGPAKMADIFFRSTNVEEKYKKKLLDAFKSFIEANEKAIKVHGTFVSQGQYKCFVMAQSAYEAGLETLKEKLVELTAEKWT